MLRISVADLIAADVALNHAEAAALTLAVADALARSGEARMPPDDQIFLSSTGELIVGNGSASPEFLH